MSAPVFEARHLRVERDAVILHEVNWRVERGQHWVILGANGSGKTSLLSALTGYLMPTRGEISIGADHFGASDWRDVRKSVGLVSSSLGHRIEPDQTARDVVLSGHNAEINFWGRAAAAVLREAARVLRQVRAAHLAERAWRHLSQGERQRVRKRPAGCHLTVGTCGSV
jgi:iron complex transport system ATP-binding protein